MRAHPGALLLVGACVTFRLWPFGGTKNRDV